MSSYLDFAIEKKDENGKWKFSMKSSYKDDAIVNPYILKDIFQYDLTDIEDISDFDDSKTKCIMSEKFPEYLEKDERYPYNKNKVLYPCEWGSYSKDDILDCLKTIYEHEDDMARFSDIALRMKDKRPRSVLVHLADSLLPWYGGTFAEFLDDENIFCENDNTFYYKFRTAYAAYNFVKYNIMLKGFDYKDIFDVVCFITYSDNDGNVIPQYITNNVKVSYPNDLHQILGDLEKDYEDYKTSINDENRLRKLLQELLDEEDLKGKTPLVKKIKAFMKGGNLNYYTQEEIDDLTAKIEEMKLLIRLVGENGRIVWKISC